MEKMKIHAFKIRFTEADSKRFEDYANHTAIKKYMIARKAILEYLDRQYQDART